MMNLIYCLLALCFAFLFLGGFVLIMYLGAKILDDFIKEGKR